MNAETTSPLWTILGILLLSGSLACTVLSGRAAFDSRAAEQTIAETLNYKETAGNTWDKAVYIGTFGLIGERHEQRVAELKALRQKANEAQTQAQLYGAGALALSLIYILLPLPRTDRPGLRRRLRVRRLIPVAAIALAAGVTLPMLSAVTAIDVPVVGQVVIEAQSKSILGTVAYLAESDLLLASLIALFSVVTPAAKLVLLSLLARREDAPRLHAAVERIGRWSMTDVFVVALLLTFLALGTRNENSATIELGFYYFLAAALLPIAAMEILPSATDRDNSIKR